VAFGLGLAGAEPLPAGQGDPPARPVARMVSRDDGPGEDHLEEALAALIAEGAALLIAGVDRAQATAAAAFARASEVPVLLLHPPDPDAVAGPFVFVVGEEPARVVDALVSALAERGARSVALVGDASTVASTPRNPAIAIALACDGPLQVRSLRSAAVQGLALNGDSFCAERALAVAQPLGLRAAFGFDAGPEAARGGLVATAGAFPLLAGTTTRRLEGWLALHPGPPTWWAALGRDAGVLAWAGVRGLPARGTEDRAEVKARRRAAAAAVAGAEAELWTTGAKGFGKGNVLPREIGHREVALGATLGSGLRF
jgi:hypothetical protein